ncbi:MAG: hypothetical protein HFG34_12880, partial [Eubacterium sp.]|nr:hypothetical protein [Eubacterium sp.]
YTGCSGNIKKSNQHSGKLKQPCFIEVSKAEKKQKREKKRRLNVSRVLEILGVSKNGYYAFKKRKPSGRQRKMEKRMEEIRQIHKESHEI